MELFRNIRLKIGKSILAKKMIKTKRQVRYSNFGMVKSIGIVWDASNTTEFTSLSKFYQKMHERNIDVRILGYFSGKELPDQYTALRYLTCFRRNELNLYYLPITPEANTFIKNNFDVLIDINQKKMLPLQYLSFLSEAAFKVGLFEPETPDSPFDLMMDMKNPIDTDSYLNQVIHYLEMINSGTENK
jgi:hypothetical protein